MKEHDDDRRRFVMSDTALLGLTAIVSIFLIVFMAVNSGYSVSTDNVGQVSGLVKYPAGSMCQIIIGQTMLYDNNNIAVSLMGDENTYYEGYNIAMKSVKDDGCILNIGGSEDFIAVGQIQKVGPLYVTVKNIIR